MWGVPQKVCVAIAKELSPHFRLVGFWETDKGNGVIVETDDGEQRLLSHEQYNDLMKARKSKGKKNETAYAKDEYGDVYFIEPNEITADDWELYEEPIDWQYIIDHKCPCWFWDYDFSYKVMRFLRNIEIDLNRPFLDENHSYWKNCRPVRRDEVTFYEDRKDDKQKS